MKKCESAPRLSGPRNSLQMSPGWQPRRGRRGAPSPFPQKGTNQPRRAGFHSSTEDLRSIEVMEPAEAGDPFATGMSGSVVQRLLRARNAVRVQLADEVAPRDAQHLRRAALVAGADVERVDHPAALHLLRCAQAPL